MLSLFHNKAAVIGTVGFFLASGACGNNRSGGEEGTKETKGTEEKKEEPTEYSHKQFVNEAEALEEILARTKPRAVGFGEFHQQENTRNTLSSLERFSDSLLPVLAGKTSDLIVETWVGSGNCGKQELKVLKDVDEVTKRPKATEDETVRLLKKALGLGIKPHILTIRCEDYDKIIDGDGGVDYFGLLKLIGGRLGEKGGQILAAAGSGNKEKIVALYGGAIHNDVAPADDWKDFSFASEIEQASGGRYVEVDLYVPEFIENNKTLQAESWFALFERFVSADKTLLIELGPKSYVIVFRKGVAGLKEEPASSR